MSGDLIVSLLWIAAAMALVASGLLRRRLPLRQGFALALLWAGIFALAYAVARLLSPSA